MSTNGSERLNSVLLVAHFYPPSREVAAHRPAALAKYLARRGHDVTVLTTAAFGTGAEPGAGDPAVARTRDLQLTVARLRGQRTAQDAMSRGESSGPTLVGRLAVPDGHLLAWMPFAWPHALSLFRRHRYDCVLTTSPPESAHFVGRSLQRRGAAWIADLRDGWTFEPVVKKEIWPFEVQHRLSAWLERRTLHCADLITAVSAPLVADARRRFGNAELVTNGYDPENIVADDDPEELDPARFSFVYTGRIAGATSRDAAPLVAAVGEIARTNPQVARGLELVFAGSFSREEAALFATDVAPARIVNLGLVSHEHALALQRAADALVLITEPGLGYQVPAKLYEYLASGRPILALGSPDNAASPILADTAAGLLAHGRDSQAIQAAVIRIMSGEFTGADADARAQYSYPAIAERLGQLVDQTVERVRNERGH